MNTTIQKIAKKLNKHNEFRIVYHIRPDGDCICSAYALALALRTIGKKVEVVGSDPIPRIHRYMTNLVPMDKLETPVYIAVDSASLARVGTFSDEHFTFCIDHHDNTFTNVDYSYIEQDCGACCEIIFKLIRSLNVPITKEMADFLYTGLITDTMCFRTSSTTVQTFEIAAELARLGADTYHLSRLHTFTKPKGRMIVEGILNKSLHFTCDERIVTGIITLVDLKTAGVEDSDLEGINSLVEQIEGIRIGVTIRELPDGTSRCSMRSNGEISVRDICKIHGGGGHFHAACCELKMPPDEARIIIEKTCSDYLTVAEGL